jgi:hypothetical protein
MPPALNIPQRVTDLSVIQRGPRIVAEFTLPVLTTEGLVITTLGPAELRIGLAELPVQVNSWSAHAQTRGETVIDHGKALIEFPAAEWMGQTVVTGVRVLGVKSKRDAGWSNLVTLSVVPPLETPGDLRAEAVPTGVRLSWQSPGANFRVLRRTGPTEKPAPLGKAEHAEYLDNTTEYGKTYHYTVQSTQTGPDIRAESDFSNEAEITPEDRFPPAVPSALTAIASTGSIEVAWERNTEEDLAGYRVYRAEGAGQFQRVSDTHLEPSFSDRQTVKGAKYRYAVSSVDKTGNESAMSAPVDIDAP